MKFHTYDELISNNKEWVTRKLGLNPHYFDKLSEKQKPPFLYIGCSDSRQSSASFTQTEPGEIFKHNNIANQVSLTDMNLLSVLEYSVEVLKVKHIIVCGHYNCGGVTAAVKEDAQGLVEDWIAPIKDLYLQNKKELDQIKNIDKKIDRLSEINVVSQVRNLCKTSTMHKAFNRKKYPKLHGWIFDIYTGLIKELELPLERWREIGLIPRNY